MDTSTLSHLSSSIPWYLTRAAGILSAILLFLLAVSGIGLVTGFTYRIWEPIKAWAIHRALGITLTISVLVHVGSLLFDKYMNFSITNIFIPFNATFKNSSIFGISLGSLTLALGIFAFYLLIPVIYTSLLTMEKKPKTWKLLHFLSYLVAIFVFIHGFYLGTDLAIPAIHYTAIVLGLLMLYAIYVRLRHRVKVVNSEANK